MPPRPRRPSPGDGPDQYGGRLVLSETAGKFALSQSLSWTRLDDKVSDNNDVETTGVNLTAAATSPARYP